MHNHAEVGLIAICVACILFAVTALISQILTTEASMGLG